MKPSIDISSSGFVKKTAKQAEQDTKKTLSNVITRVATLMERTAKENLHKAVHSTPTPSIPGYSRTSKSRQSINRGVLGAYSQRVYMGVNYGKYIEEGTGIYNGRRPYWTTFGGLLPRPILYKGMKARPFWKPAIKTTRQEIPNIWKQEYKSISK